MNDIREALENVLKSVYGQQQKAETKHAGLLAFNAATISALFKEFPAIYSKYFDIHGTHSGNAFCPVVFAISGGVFLIFSVVLSTWSFFPNLKTTPIETAGETCLPESTVLETPVMSFLAAARFSCGKAYLNMFKKTYSDSDTSDNKLPRRKQRVINRRLRALRPKGRGIRPKSNKYNNQLAAQIVHNSKIALSKYRKFKPAVIVSLIGLVLVLLSFAFYLVK